MEVLVEPLCDLERCRTRVLQETLKRTSWFTTAMGCKVCAKVDGVMKCGRCQVVAYCGKAHQKVDWAAHKAGCIAPREVNDSGAAQAGSVRPRPTSTEDAHVFEDESSDDAEAVYEFSYSAIFEADDGTKVELTKEDVLAYLLSSEPGDE